MDEGLWRFVLAHTTRSHSVKYNESPPVPIVAVFTKYDVLVDSLRPLNEDDFYGDIEEEMENLDKELGVNPKINSITKTSAPQVDPYVLSEAERILGEMIMPFEKMLSVPWVKVSGLYTLTLVLSARSNWLISKTVNPEFTDTLDKLEDMTRKCINSSLGLLWAITQQQGVEPKVKASIESVPSFCDIASDCADICIVLARKVRFKVYFWFCIHHVQLEEYWWGLSTSLKLASGGKSLEKWFKVIHRDTMEYIHCFLHIFSISCL